MPNYPFPRPAHPCGEHVRMCFMTATPGSLESLAGLVDDMVRAGDVTGDLAEFMLAVSFDESFAVVQNVPVERLYYAVVVLIAVTVVFPSITPGRALTTLGLGSVAIGFAFKDTFENFLAGILILLREPFRGWPAVIRARDRRGRPRSARPSRESDPARTAHRDATSRRRRHRREGR